MHTSYADIYLLLFNIDISSKKAVSKFIALHKDFNKSKHFPMFIELILYVIPIENTAKIRDESKTRLSYFSDMSKSFLLYRFIMGVVTIFVYLFIYQFGTESAVRCINGGKEKKVTIDKNTFKYLLNFYKLIL